jgi:hypothetical protein
MTTRLIRSSALRNLALVAAGFLLVATASRADKVDLSTLFGDYSAPDGTTLTGTLTGNYQISIADGATVTLDGAKIVGTNSPSFQWAGLTCEGDATIVLSKTNVVKGFYSSYPAIHVPAGKTLTIRGNGKLTASGNGNSAGIGGGFKVACGNIFVEGGTITATGGWGAGIGAGYGASCGEIRIMDGIITAQGGNGSAGIGGGYNPEGNTNGLCGDILITGGTVTATGSEHGAGIGAGNNFPCGDIRLDGGLVVATAGNYAAGIGGAWMASCGDITITFGIDRVTATMGESAIHIGAGYGASCGTISIADGLNDMTRGATRIMTSWDGFLAAMTHNAAALDGMTLFGTLTGNYKVSIADGATVTLEGVTILGTDNSIYPWAGITCEGDATIILSGANTIRGFYSSYPGIYVPSGKTVTIRGSGSLKASSNGSGAGIGGGRQISCGNIVIENGDIAAIGGREGAGIGGACQASCGDISISNAKIMATGGEYAAGIGSGRYYVSCGNISITNAKVTATGGAYGAGIGTGEEASSCKDITISGGEIISTGGEHAAGIGGGGSPYSSTYNFCGNISISDGTIATTGGYRGAGIGGGLVTPCATILIKGGQIVATGGNAAAGIGGGYAGSCTNVSITGGEIIATGGEYAAGIGGGQQGNCNSITIGTDIIRVTAAKGNASVPSPIGKGVSSTCETVTIDESLEKIQSDDGTTLTVQPHYAYFITWLDDAGGEIDRTEVVNGEVPTHAEPVSTQTAEAPYRYVFTGWTPEPVAATEDATYTATFARVADLSLLTSDWSPADGDVLLPAETPYQVTIPAGASVTIAGVALASEGSSSSAPVFSDGGAALITAFAPSEKGTWTLEAYGDLSSGTAEGVTADMVQVYSADTVEGLATASPLSSGVVLKNTQNAVKATLEVSPSSTSETQFFRIQFTEER